MNQGCRKKSDLWVRNSRNYVNYVFKCAETKTRYYAQNKKLLYFKFLWKVEHEAAAFAKLFNEAVQDKTIEENRK